MCAWSRARKVGTRAARGGAGCMRHVYQFSTKSMVIFPGYLRRFGFLCVVFQLPSETSLSNIIDRHESGGWYFIRACSSTILLSDLSVLYPTLQEGTGTESERCCRITNTLTSEIFRTRTLRLQAALGGCWSYFCRESVCYISATIDIYCT